MYGLGTYYTPLSSPFPRLLGPAWGKRDSEHKCYRLLNWAGVALRLHCQMDRIQDHLGETLLRMYVRGFPKRRSSECGWHIPWAGA